MNFYVTGGTLRLDAPSYVERQADKDLLDGLLLAEEPNLVVDAQFTGQFFAVAAVGAVTHHQELHAALLPVSFVAFRPDAPLK